ncbi:MAG TPA: hypothetical protein VKB80_34685 [Kofleriaceae bacterium]|nr:hypothetical protein [Kofleriaceae bacterium]
MSLSEALQREVETFRQRYRDGLGGEWLEFHDRGLGVGFTETGLFGGLLEIRPDGTGTYESWGFRSRGRADFRWRPTAPWQVEISGARTVDVDGDRDDDEEDPPCVVSYDFFADEDSGLVLMRQAPAAGGDDSFWLTAGPLRLVRP